MRRTFGPNEQQLINAPMAIEAVFMHDVVTNRAFPGSMGPHASAVISSRQQHLYVSGAYMTMQSSAIHHDM